MTSLRYYIVYLLLFPVGLLYAQQRDSLNANAITMFSGLAEINEQLPEGAILVKDSIAVTFLHKGSIMKCDSAYFFEKDNRFEAYGHVKVNMGDTVFMDSDYLDYDGNINMMHAAGQVNLRNRKLTLETEELFYDRNTNQAYYDNYGTVKDEANTMSSQIGAYYVNENKAEFKDDVYVLTNLDKPPSEQHELRTPLMVYYPQTKDVITTGPTIITSQASPKNRIYTEAGTYNTATMISTSSQNGKIYYQGNVLTGDNIYYETRKGYGNVKGRVTIRRPAERMLMKGQYAEYYHATDPAVTYDSVFITKQAYAAKAYQQDSIYFHAKRIEGVQQPDTHYIIRAYTQARSYSQEGQVRADSLVYHDRSGNMQLYKDPVLWYDEGQLTGDTIYTFLYQQKLDSAVVMGNAMALVKIDSTSDKTFNQIKGRWMYATFRDQANGIDFVHVDGNAQSIVYVDEQKKNNQPTTRIGIDYSSCAYINALITNKELQEVSCHNGTQSKLSPESMVYEQDRFLKGFIWRDKEKFADKEAFLDFVRQTTEDVDTPNDNRVPTRSQVLLNQLEPLIDESAPTLYPRPWVWSSIRFEPFIPNATFPFLLNPL